MQSLRAHGHQVSEFHRDRLTLTRWGVADDVQVADCVVWAASSINPMTAQTQPQRAVDDQETFARFLAHLARRAEPPRQYCS